MNVVSLFRAAEAAWNHPSWAEYSLLVTTVWIGWTLTKPFFTPRRVGKSRLWSLVPGQVPMRCEIEKYAARGYARFHKAMGKPFVMKFFGLDYLMMPPKYLGDLRQADFENASFGKSFSDAFNLHASVGDLYMTPNMIDVVTRHLNPQLASLIPLLADENDYAFATELGVLLEWKSVNASRLCAILTHRITSRVLVGKHLCRNKDYLDTSMAFFKSLFINGILWNFMTLGPLRRLVVWFTTVVYHRRDLDRAVSVLLPTIRRRLEEQNFNTEPQDQHIDAIQWTMDIAGSDARESEPHRLAQQVLHLLFAASSAPGGLVTQMIYQTLMQPNEYLKPLREEIKTALAENDGWTSKALDHMRLLDSFIRETLRIYPTGVVACTRTLVKDPFTFHDGMTLPAGSRFAFPVLAVHLDQDNYSNAAEFQGFRFAGDGKGKEHSSTVDKTFLTFGYGKHACPGRFYAVRKARLIFGKLINEYDIEWASPVSSRPSNISMEGMNGPNGEQEIYIRSRRQ